MNSPIKELPDDADDDSPRRSPVPWLVGGFLSLFALFLVINTLVTDSDSTDGEVITTTASGETISVPRSGSPVEATFELLDGGTSTLGAHRGTPTVVNFFASWCPPCVRELPDIQAAAETFAGQVDVIGLAVSDRETDTRALVESAGVTFLVGLDPNGTIHRETSELGTMPTTLFLNADGNLVSSVAGAISADDLDELIRTQLLSDES